MAIFQRPISGSPQGVPFSLAPGNVTLIEAILVDSKLRGLEFDIGDQRLHVGRRDGNDTKSCHIGNNEQLTNISWTVAPAAGSNGIHVSSMGLVSDAQIWSAGEQPEGAEGYVYSFLPGERLCGFAGRAGFEVFALGVFLETTDVQVHVSLDGQFEGVPLTADVINTINVYNGDKITWTEAGMSVSSFQFSGFELYHEGDPSNLKMKWHTGEAPWTSADCHYAFDGTPDAARISIQDTEEGPAGALQTHTYKIWAVDGSGIEHVLDPEVLNFGGRKD